MEVFGCQSFSNYSLQMITENFFTLSESKLKFISKPYLWMCFSLVYLILISYGRLLWTGTVNLDMPPVRLEIEITTRTLQIFGFLVWGLAFLRFLTTKQNRCLDTKLFIQCIMIHLIAAFSLPLTSNDLFSNFAYGELAQLGMNPNTHSPFNLPESSLFKYLVSPVWLHTPSVYGPLIDTVNTWLIQNSLWKTILIYKVFYLSIALMAVCASYFFLKKQNSKPNTLIFSAFAFNPLFIWDISGQTHNDALLMLCLLAFVLLVLQNHWILPLLALLFGVLFKLGSLPLLIIYIAYLLHQPQKKWILLLIPLCAFILYWHPEIYEKLKIVLVSPNNQNPETARITNSIPFLFFFLGGIFQTSYALYFYKTYWIFSASLLFLWAGKLCLKSKSSTEMLMDCFSYLFILLYAFAPSFQPWYLLWLLPFIHLYETDKRILLMALLPCLYLMIYPIFWSVLVAIINAIVLWYFVQTLRTKPAAASSP